MKSEEYLNNLIELMKDLKGIFEGYLTQLIW